MNLNSTIKTSNKSWQVIFDELPTSLKMLRDLPESSLNESYYAPALLIPSLCLWSINKDEAINMINFLKGPQPLSIREIQFINERLRSKEYLPYSYFEGTSPQNCYKSLKPYIVKISTVPTSFDEAGYGKL